MKTIHSAEYRALLGWLREQRQSRGLTMRAVAAKLDVPHSWICKIETGERRLDVCEYLALCQAIGCDYQEGMRRPPAQPLRQPARMGTGDTPDSTRRVRSPAMPKATFASEEISMAGHYA